MSTVTITIADVDDSITMQGTIDNPDAINEPPTAALIVGSYLAANAGDICRAALVWFQKSIVAPERDEDVARLIVPGGTQ